MAHFNPRGCEDYCCFVCRGTIQAVCGLLWTTEGAVNARILDDEDNVVATGHNGYLPSVPAGTYRLQVQCANGADWVLADEAELEEQDCNCSDIYSRVKSFTIRGWLGPTDQGFATRPLYEEPVIAQFGPCLNFIQPSYTFPIGKRTRFLQSGIVTEDQLPLVAELRVSRQNPLPTSAQDIRDNACLISEVSGVTYYLMLNSFLLQMTIAAEGQFFSSQTPFVSSIFSMRYWLATDQNDNTGGGVVSLGANWVCVTIPAPYLFFVTSPSNFPVGLGNFFTPNFGLTIHITPNFS